MTTRLIMAALVAALALAGCDAVPGRPRPDARELAPTEVMAFEPLYARNCAGCHGETGRLGPARALNDPVYLALVPPEHVRQVITTGVPGTRSAGGAQAPRWDRKFRPTTEDERGTASPATRIADVASLPAPALAATATRDGEAQRAGVSPIRPISHSSAIST